MLCAAIYSCMEITCQSRCRIYSIQDQGYSFSSVADLLSAMDPSFSLMLEKSLEDGLTEMGLSEMLIQELAMAVMRVNYGQTTDAHQFVGTRLRIPSICYPRVS